jgi:putative membrane protein
MIEIILFLLLGIGFGILGGLAPGIHPNTLAIIFSGMAWLFSSPQCFIAFMVAMGITSSVLDFLPSIFLGSPDESTALSVLPGHRLLRKGLGYHAIRLAVIGSVGSIILCTALLPVAMISFPLMYSFSRPWMHIILSFVVVFMILTERKKLMASFCFLSAGLVGLFGSSLPISQNFYLFPVLSGLFGIPVLLLSLKNREEIPEQRKKVKRISTATIGRHVLKGSLAGIIVGLLPGVGPSQAAFLTDATSVRKKGRGESFLISLGSVTTANTLFSFLALWLIGNPRSGVAVAIANFTQIGFNDFLLMVVVSLVATGIAAIITLRIARMFVSFLPRINYFRLNLFVLALIFSLVIYFTGIFGLFIALLTTSLGMLANLSGIRRSHLMGVLILPTILFFSGL